MPPLPLYPNQATGSTDINWNALASSGGYDQGSQNSSSGGYYPGYYTSIDEARTRYQEESDREYELKAKGIEQQAQSIAISKGQAAATKWYNEQMVSLAKDKLQEEQRQFDATFGENQRQFNTTASGYLDNGQNTLARDQFQDNSLQSWTKTAVDLGSRPQDWIKYKRYTTGVNSNIGNIPGLAWTRGGQVGNTTAVTDQAAHPTNSLGNVLGAMGIAGQGGDWASQAAGQSAQLALTPDEQAIYGTANEFASNPQGAAPGWWESLDPSTQQSLQGAAEAQGHDWASAMSRYKRSQWGGSSGVAAA